jgi:hypothetical protein
MASHLFIAGASIVAAMNHSAGHACHVISGLPDLACTPGAVLSVRADQVCSSGYAGSARRVSAKQKRLVFREYGITNPRPGEYVADHLISLELGGSNDLKNLWPEPVEPRPGSHEKDKLETYLHKEVCNGAMSLAQAQQAIRTDWLTFYRSAFIQASR